jgi:hypothetical protein
MSVQSEPDAENDMIQESDQDSESDSEDGDEVNDSQTVEPPRNIGPYQTTRVDRVNRFPNKFKNFIAIPATIELNPYDNPFAYAASSDTDIMYIKVAMNAVDSDHFVLEMQDEVKAHVDNKNWMIVHKSEFPANRKILPAVW